MARYELGAPKLPAKPLTREEILPIAARIYAAGIDGPGVPDVDTHQAYRRLAVMHAIELANEVDRQL